MCSDRTQDHRVTGWWLRASLSSTTCTPPPLLAIVGMSLVLLVFSTSVLTGVSVVDLLKTVNGKSSMTVPPTLEDVSSVEGAGSVCFD